MTTESFMEMYWNEVPNFSILKEWHNDLFLNFPHSYLAGGFLKSIMYGLNDHQDIDVFTSSAEESNRLIDLYHSKYKYIDNNENGQRFEFKDNIIQVVYPRDKTPLDTISKFDFSIVRAYYEPEENSVVCSMFFAHDNTRKQINIEYIRNLNSTVHRINKYIKKGYSLRSGEIIKIWRYLNAYPELLSPVGDVVPHDIPLTLSDLFSTNSTGTYPNEVQSLQNATTTEF